MRWKIGLQQGRDDVSCCFGSCTEKGWGLAPSHLQTIRYDDLDVVECRMWISWWNTVAKIPRVVIVHHEPPKAVLDIEFCKGKLFFLLLALCDPVDDTFEGVAKLGHGIGRRKFCCAVIDGWFLDGVW